jgi:flagellar biosynthesis protein FlhA
MAAAGSVVLQQIKKVGIFGVVTPIMVLALLAMVVLPLPPFALDLLFTFNIALSLVVLLVTVYALRPLDFAAFPTVLLMATLLRLALNIASTRVVLLEGHTGTDAAGRVIEAFGAFVIGGNFAVGLVVFSILVIINFVVVTKGAGRVSEVTARFTLDAMPGKQMAIDADLNAGIISQEEALARRETLGDEAEFYGSMDGASKFVRGDAIAGIAILVINILGGLFIGTLQHDLSLTQAAQNYVLLTIGDGLVAQIPSLLLSVATAIIITRVSRSGEMGEQIRLQVFSNPRVLTVGAAVIGLMGMVPGMPNLVFLLLAGAMLAAAWMLTKKEHDRQVAESAQAQQRERQAESSEPKELSWNDVGMLDTVGLEVGYRLIPMVDKAQGGQLMPRIKGVRKKLSQELGFLVSPVHIRDNLELRPTEYRITLKGVAVASGEVLPDRELAINPGKVYGELKGTPTRDPSFGLDAVWIEAAQREQAQTLGYTVVDASTVVATHLSQTLQGYASELLGFEEAQQVLDHLSQRSPKLVEDLVPKVLPLATVVKVLRNLLAEGVSIRDIRTVIEALANQAPLSPDPDRLLVSAREAMGRSIVQGIIGNDNELPLMTLDPQLEQLLHQSINGASGNQLGIEPSLAERLQRSVNELMKRQSEQGQASVLVTSPELRPWLARLLRPALKELHVLSYTEIPDNRSVRVVGSVGQEAARANA